MIADRSHSTSRFVAPRSHARMAKTWATAKPSCPTRPVAPPFTPPFTHTIPLGLTAARAQNGGAPSAISKVMGRRKLLCSEREGHQQLQHTEASNAPQRRRRARGTSTSQSRRSRHENLVSRRTCRHDEFASR